MSIDPELFGDLFPQLLNILCCRRAPESLQFTFPCLIVRATACALVNFPMHFLGDRPYIRRPGRPRTSWIVTMLTYSEAIVGRRRLRAYD